MYTTLRLPAIALVAAFLASPPSQVLLSGAGQPEAAAPDSYTRGTNQAVMERALHSSPGTPVESFGPVASNAYGGRPLSFEVNQGQTDSRVRFLSRGPGYTLFLTSSEGVLALQGSHDAAVLQMRIVGASPGVNPGANPGQRVAGLDRLAGTANYFIGNDPERWRTGIPTYRKVRYQGVLPGVDLIYYGKQRQLEYDLVVGPGADPSAIRLAFDGARRLRLDAAGDLVIEAKGGELRQHRPAIYQDINGKRRAVSGNYVLKGGREVGFRVGAYDRSRTLVIDPILAFSTYLGGGGDETGAGIAVDGGGNVYVAGTTNSLDFPATPNIQGGPGGGKDVFVTKFNSSASAIIYSTYLGGSADDIGTALAVDASGNAYVTGYTLSGAFPTKNATQPVYGGTVSSTYGDAFVAKIDPNGSSLLYSTYLGGAGDDAGFAIAADSAGSAYVTGVTSSGAFPVTSGTFRNFLSGTSDAFVTKLAPAGSLVYSTYLGGSAADQGNGIAIDASGNAYIAGSTVSLNFPTVQAFQPSCAASPTPFGTTCADAFITKLNAAGNALVYSTYLGGQASDFAQAIAVDAAGSAYVTGTTNSINFPISSGVVRPTLGGSYDAFVTKLSPTGFSLVYSTFLGGNGPDTGYAVGIDGGGNAYVAGSTSSTDFPTLAAFQPSCAGSVCNDAFVTALNPSGSALLYSSYLGGADVDKALAITVDHGGFAYVAGETHSLNFPTTSGVYQTTLKGSSDAFVVKIVGAANTAPLLSLLSPSSVAPGGPDLHLTVVGSGFAAGSVVRWNGLDRPTTFVNAGQLSALIYAADTASAGSAQVTVFNPPPGGGLSNALPFVIGGNPIPAVGTLLPSSAAAGSPGFTLVVLGSGFIPTSVVQWNGASRPTTYISGAQLQAAISAADLTAGGVALVSVFNPPPGGGQSAGASFSTIDPVPAPSSLSPPGATAGSDAFVLTVNGSNFVPGAVVLWNGNSRSTTFVSGTQLQAAIPASDIAATGTAQIRVFNPPPGGGLSTPLTFSIISAPIILPGGVVNAASFGNQPVAAGTIVSLFGSNLSPGTATASAIPLPTSLGGVSVLMNSIAAPLLFVSPLQINFIIPWELQGRSSASLSVQVGSVASSPLNITLAPFDPAVFSTNLQGTGQGAILIAGTSSVAAPAGALPGSRPAFRSSPGAPSFVEIYCAGLGAVTNTPPTGGATPASPLSTTILPSVTIGNVPATVTFSGLAPGFVALYQVNVQVPSNAPVGSAVPVALTIGGAVSNTVMMAVQ